MIANIYIRYVNFHHVLKAYLDLLRFFPLAHMNFNSCKYMVLVLLDTDQQLSYNSTVMSEVVDVPPIR